MAKNYELRIEVSELKKALDVLSTVTNRKMALPIMADVLIGFNREKKTFSLLAGNSEQFLQIEAVKTEGDEQKELRPWMFLDDEDRKAPFESFCINLAAMKEAFSVLPTMPVRAFIDLEQNTMRVDYGKGEFTMPINSDGTPDQYPEVPFVVEKDGEQKAGISPLVKFSIETESLLPVVAAARCCSANDEIRPVINTVCLDCFHDHVVVVASDGHSLFKKILDTGMGWLRYGEFPADQSAKLLIPTAALTALTKAFTGCATLTVTADQQRVRIDGNEGGITLSSVTIDGVYPNYESVIPKTRKYLLVIDRQEIVTSLRRITIFSAEASNMCVLRKKDDHIELYTADDLMGRNANEQVSIISTDGEEMQEGFQIGCKISTLMKLFECIKTDNIRMELTERSRPILLKEDNDLSGLTMLAMPMLIDQSND